MFSLDDGSQITRLIWPRSERHLEKTSGSDRAWAYEAWCPVWARLNARSGVIIVSRSGMHIWFRSGMHIWSRPGTNIWFRSGLNFWFRSGMSGWAMVPGLGQIECPLGRDHSIPIGHAHLVQIWCADQNQILSCVISRNICTRRQSELGTDWIYRPV